MNKLTTITRAVLRMFTVKLIHQHRTALVTVQDLVLVSVFHSALAVNTWDGGGTNDHWATAANWDDNSVPGFAAALTFAGTNRLTPENSFSNVTIDGITFDVAAGASTLSGNGISLGGNIGCNGNPSTLVKQRIYLDITLTGDRAFVTQSNGWITVGGGISGSHGSTKLNHGVLKLSATNVYTGSTVIHGGGRAGSDNKRANQFSRSAGALHVQE